jgi:ABC-2 type transport system ATP-binding protein
MTFTVRPGQVTGFAGPNGAGKSTTMRVVVGLDAPARAPPPPAASRTAPRRT